MLEATHLTKAYGRHLALDDLNLHIGPGEVFCLLGANGAGKTTTINLFLNFVEPTSGTAKVSGMDVATHPVASKKHVAYVPEQVALYCNLTGVENLEYFHGLSGRERHSRANLIQILGQAGLPRDAAVKRVSTYSKGMRQKVAIAIAIAKEADVLLLDEPTSGLDPRAANEFGVLIRELSDRGAAVLMATHDLFRAKETGTRVGIMRAGKLRTSLGTAEIAHAELEQLYLEHMRD
jgi:ABC-2 type transport system ATP-binding protein